MDEFNAYLKKFPNYSPAAFKEVVPYIKTKELAAGEYFLQHGKTCKQLGFIQEGLVRLFYLNDGKEVTHCFCKEKSLTCSFRSFITQEESDIAIQAIEPTKLLVLSYDSLQELYEHNQFWQQAGRIAAEQEYIITDAHNRFIRDLSATEKYLHILEKESELLNRVPLNYLATYLQISPETLSRIRKKITP
jgi:CRP-like cAMP-binding protein